jgi:microtubule-associated protein-like 1/2
VRAVAFKPDGRRLAVGLQSGAVEVLEVDTTGRLVMNEKGDGPVVVARLKGPKRAVQELKYSFEGSFLAVGAHDSAIYVYDGTEQGESYKLLATLKRHSSSITHIDFGVLPQPAEAGSVRIYKGELCDLQTYV